MFLGVHVCLFFVFRVFESLVENRVAPAEKPPNGIVIFGHDNYADDNFSNRVFVT